MLAKLMPRKMAIADYNVSHAQHQYTYKVKNSKYP
jgi:hypothetical protein